MNRSSLEDEIRKLPFYTKYPHMIPHVGEEYTNAKLKLILIGESHYMPKDSPKSIIDSCSDTNIWYDGNSDELKDEYRLAWDYTNTRGVINSFMSGDKAKGYTIFHNINRELMKSRHFKMDKPFNSVVFYNYFLRPAKTGLSIEHDALDAETSFTTFQELMKLLEPNLIAFMSAKAYSVFQWSQNQHKNYTHQNIIKNFPHPGMQWWNRQSTEYTFDNRTMASGREKFEWIIS